MDEVFARGAAYAASRISSTLKGSTKQFGWLQAPATKTSLPSATSANPATIRIVCRDGHSRKLRLKTLPRFHDGFGMIDSFRFTRNQELSGIRS
jgi:hypothetical protein